MIPGAFIAIRGSNCSIKGKRDSFFFDSCNNAPREKEAANKLATNRRTLVAKANNLDGNIMGPIPFGAIIESKPRRDVEKLTLSKMECNKPLVNFAIFSPKSHWAKVNDSCAMRFVSVVR
jgi:hypothetical protein